jgi:hypothetical protein
MTGKRRQRMPPKGPYSLRQPVSRGCPNGPGTAHNHVPDGGGRFLVFAGADELELMRQQPLLDEDNLILRRIKGDRPEVLGSTAERDVHAASASVGSLGLKSRNRRGDHAAQHPRMIQL